MSYTPVYHKINDENWSSLVWSYNLDEAKQALNSPWPLSDAVLYCEQCNKPCCVSAVSATHDACACVSTGGCWPCDIQCILLSLQVMNETGPVVLCLRHAAVELKKESSVKDFKILSRYDVVSRRFHIFSEGGDPKSTVLRHAQSIISAIHDHQALSSSSLKRAWDGNM